MQFESIIASHLAEYIPSYHFVLLTEELELDLLFGLRTYVVDLLREGEVGVEGLGDQLDSDYGGG